MTYKLIALDVDGTLITDDHRLTEPTRLMLQKLHREGRTIVLCTGRGPMSALPILEQLGFGSVLITHNGALTLSSEGPTTIHQFSFRYEDIRPIIDYCRQKGIHFDINTAFEMYVEQMPENAEEMYGKYFAMPQMAEHLDDMINEEWVKFTAFGPPEEMDRMEADLRRLYPELARLRMIRSGVSFIDMMHKEATKGKALAQYCKSADVKPEEVVAFGNYYNDVEMLQFAGLSYAVDNAPEEVKLAADRVTLSNNDDGVFAALKALFQ
ncbi:Cof-type HAD-IIB family hydrolase [Marinicrinis lubricantis]|uniref:Cof-type HAD-IIB family hydrolase n=1 Tax=Marinicrinis lubricantis TaxID=2086470 RepID=A0ABW1ITJ0_9BACL